MSTTALIGKKIVKDGISEVKYIYCHWDGYPEHVGKILIQYYNTEEKLDKLLDLGDISSLYPVLEPTGPHTFDNPEKGVTVAYKRDRGEEGFEAKKVLEIQFGNFKNVSCEWNYLFDNGKWYVKPWDRQVVKGTPAKPFYELQV